MPTLNTQYMPRTKCLLTSDGNALGLGNFKLTIFSLSR